jgi:NADPH:quinone reductase
MLRLGMGTTMRQVRIDRFGGPEELYLVEVPDPQPSPGQVVVRTAAAGITFIETQMRAGRSPRPGPGSVPPLVLGNGVEGEITAVGAGVDPILLDRRVVTATGGFGGYADQVVVNADDPIPIPNGLPLGTAVALLADGRTALALIRAAAIVGTDRVLFTAAAGGVGTLLVQLARAAGAKLMVGAAGSERKLAVARELGADLAVDYTKDGWVDQIRKATGGIDVAFDGVGGTLGRAAFGLVEPGGRFLRYGAASGAMTDVGDFPPPGVTLIAGHTLVKSPEDNRALVEQALAEAAAGRLRPVIGQTFPLSRAADAHAAIEARTTIGKTVLIPEAYV